MARRSSAAAQAEQARAKETIELTKEEVEKTIEEAQAGLEAAKADLMLAQQEYTRYTRLQQQEAAPLRRAQQVTQARDAAAAHKNLAAAKLAKAEADRTRIRVAARTHEAAEITTQKTVQGVSLAQTGNIQIREAELLTAVKKEMVEDARLNLTAAEDNLRFRFTVIALLRLLLPFVAVVWAGLTPREHLRRMFRIRLYVLAMSTRILLLMQIAAVLALLANYLVGLRDYPRPMAGWILATATPPMIVATILTTWFHRRSLRHFWQLVSVLGSAACLWWMLSVDNFTANEQVMMMVGCWGLFVGLIPPAFLQDEVEGLEPRDKLFGAAVGNAVLVSALTVIPSLTSTTVSAWTDRALDVERMNLRENRPEVQESSARVADYFRQRGMEEGESARMASTVLGDFARAEATAHGIRSGLRLLSLFVAGLGLLATALLALSDICRQSG